MDDFSTKDLSLISKSSDGKSKLNFLNDSELKSANYFFNNSF
jgi:hypothetical protein